MALGPATFQAAGGAVQDLFAASALRTKARGSRIEAEQYDLASRLALQNEQFSRTSTEIKQVQQQRGLYMNLGQQAADVAASGFASSGSALDLLRDSASQGALTKAVVGQQGLIEQAGYRQQAQSFQLMSSAARMAARADEDAADMAPLTAMMKIGASLATLAV